MPAEEAAMCRSIKRLRPVAGSDGAPATRAEVEAAALQFVRKISGFRRPSRANQAAFESAVAAITATAAQLLATLPAPERNR
jgi:hypothetical protein